MGCAATKKVDTQPVVPQQINQQQPNQQPLYISPSGRLRSLPSAPATPISPHRKLSSISLRSSQTPPVTSRRIRTTSPLKGGRFLTDYKKVKDLNPDDLVIIIKKK